MPPNLKNLKPFQKGQSGIPNGRPPDALNTSLKRLTKEELEEIASLIIKGSHEDLKAVMIDPETSVIRLMIASAALKIIEEGNMSDLDKLLNRLIGKVKDTVEVGSNAALQTIVHLNIPDNGRVANRNHCS